MNDTRLLAKKDCRSFDGKADGGGVPGGIDDSDRVLSGSCDNVHLVDMPCGTEIFRIEMPEYLCTGIAVGKIECRALYASVKLAGDGM